MKVKIYYQLTILGLLIFSSFLACEKMEDTYREFYEMGETVYIGKADSIKTAPGKNRLELSWLLLSDPKVNSYKVYWNNRRDSMEGTVTKTAGVDTVRLILENMEEDIHHFQIFMYDKLGNSSISSSAIGRVYGNNYLKSLLQRPYKSVFKFEENIIFEWLEPEETVLFVEVQYPDETGSVKTRYISNTTANDTLFNMGETGEIRYRTAFLPEPMAIDTFYTNYDVVSLNSFGSSLSVNWDKWDTSNYTYDMGVTDFGSWIGFEPHEEGRIIITGSKREFRTTLVKDEMDAIGGVVTQIDVKDHAAYELSYDVKVNSSFDWSQKGGKIGFGFLIGNGYTGGQDVSQGAGGSFRLIWSVDANGDAYFQPYVYYVDQPSQYGRSFGARYPASGSLKKNTYYTIKMFIQSNTYDNYDGKIKLTINGTEVFSDNGFRFTTQHSQRFIKSLQLATFRGGGDGSIVSSNGYVYFDNLELKSFYAPSND